VETERTAQLGGYLSESVGILVPVEVDVEALLEDVVAEERGQHPDDGATLAVGDDVENLIDLGSVGNLNLDLLLVV
jgi:hypothetical protein